MRCIRLLWTIISVAYAYSIEPRVDPLVIIQQGLVSGQKSSDGSYSTFLGIPYASVNLDNPFGASEPAPAFSGIFYAIDGSQICPQSNDYVSKFISQKGTETLDCLRLNIYVPSQAGSRNPLPVLVWIHGGGFSGGSAWEYQPKSLLKHDIIVVTINYRLGPYGFLCLDFPAVPGNQGLKDQYDALRWIRNNIAAFGGNPYKVTVAGQGSGSISALLHLYSLKTKVFDKIIAQSGTPNAYILNKDYDTAIKLANYLGNNATNNEDALTFLANASFESVAEAVTATNTILGPCAEKSFSGIENFLVTTPYMATNDRKIQNTPILLGHNSKEISGFDPFEPDNSIDPFYNKIYKHFDFSESESVEDIANNVRHFYIGDATLDINVIDEIGNFESDFTFNHPTQRTIDNLLKANPSAIYEYMFSYVANKTAKDAEHFDEIPYLFDGVGNFSDPASYLVSQNITKLWANFVKYGNPTPSASDQEPLKWPSVTSESRPFVVIDTELSLSSRIFNDRMAFWDLFYMMYGERHKLYRKCYMQ